MMLFVPLVAVGNASGFDELSGLGVRLSPEEARPSSNTHISVALTNYNNRSLTVTSVDLQIYLATTPSSPCTSYHLFTGAEPISAGGNHTFSVEARLPNYPWECSATVMITGILEGDSNQSIGVVSTGILLDPSMPLSFFEILPIIILGGVLVIAAVVVIVYLALRRT
jgi:hypothetical protein